MVVGDDIAVGGDEETGALRHLALAVRPGALFFVRHRDAEVLEEAVERAAFGERRRPPLELGIVVGDVGERDFHGDDGAFDAIDDVGERGGTRGLGRVGRRVGDDVGEPRAAERGGGRGAEPDAAQRSTASRVEGNHGHASLRLSLLKYGAARVYGEWREDEVLVMGKNEDATSSR